MEIGTTRLCHLLGGRSRITLWEGRLRVPWLLVPPGHNTPIAAARLRLPQYNNINSTPMHHALTLAYWHMLMQSQRARVGVCGFGDSRS